MVINDYLLRYFNIKILKDKTGYLVWAKFWEDIEPDLKGYPEFSDYVRPDLNNGLRFLKALFQFMLNDAALIASEDLVLEHSSSIQESISVSPGGSDNAMTGDLTVNKKVGGINFNPQGLEIETQGKAVSQTAPALPPNFEGVSINGFSPVIIQVVPVTSLPALLGYQSSEAMPLALRVNNQ